MSLIQLSGVTHFYGQACALRDVTLQVEPGAIGLIGQNGAGKSTMMQILLGLICPTSGTAVVLGHEVRSAELRLRGRVGYMPERDALVPGLSGIEYATLAGELCGFSPRQAKRRAHEMLSYLGLEEARYRRLEQYSVGMIGRLKLAATLVPDPDLLLLDEPTAGLDPQGRAAMLELLSSLAARPGKSLVLSSHLMGDIERVCKHVIVLNEGRVVSVGLLDDLRSRLQRRYRLGWEGDATDFLAALRHGGLEVQRDDESPRATVTVPDDFPTRTFFALAREHGVLLGSLEPEEENLKAIYHRVIRAPALS